MRAVSASFGAALLAASALPAQATPTEQQQIEIDHCTIMSKAVLEFARARDQGLAKMDAYNSVTHDQPYKAGSMVDQTLQWAYDHADENAEAASAHFYGHCSLDALEALTPQTEAQAKASAAACQQQNAARPDETRICMDAKISALIAAADAAPNLAPTPATAEAPRPAQAGAQTLSSTEMPVAAAAPVQAPAAAPEPAETPAPQAPEPEVAQAPSLPSMPAPVPVPAAPAAPLPKVAQAPAPMFPPLPAPAVVSTPKPVAPAPTVVAKASPPAFPPLPAPTVTSSQKPAATPVAAAEAPAPAPVAMRTATPLTLPKAQPMPSVQAPTPAIAQAPVSAVPSAAAQPAEPAKLAVAAPPGAQPKLAVLSPPSLAGVGKLTLGMAMSDAMRVFHSFGEADQDEFGAETQTFLISDGHGYVVLLTQKDKPDTLYGIEYHGGADADTAPTILGLRLGQNALAVLTRVGEPSRRERLPNSEFTRWYYDGRNYSFDVSSGGDLVAIRLYGYDGLQLPDADSDAPPQAPATP